MLIHEQGKTPVPDDANTTDDVLADSHAGALPLPCAANLAWPLPLRDGTALRQRAIRPDDAPRLQAFHSRLSDRSIFFRFAGIVPTLSAEFAERLSHVDYVNRMAIVVTPDNGNAESIIAIARYERCEPATAEFALAVEDSWQGRGVGPLLLRTLARYASHQGFTSFLANVLHDNDRMLALLHHSGLLTTLHVHDGYIAAWLDITGLANT